MNKILRATLRAATAFDWISPIIHTIEDAAHGSGWAIFVAEEQLEDARDVLDQHGIGYWSAERYGPFDSEASLTVANDDHDNAIYYLKQARVKVTQ